MCCAWPAAGLAGTASAGHAQSTWPTKPVTMIVPFPAGGGTDAFARPLSAQFARLTGKQLIIDNRGGAGGTLGASIAAKAQPDGYTLFMGAVHHTIAPSMYPKLDYDLEKDFVPLILVASVPQVLVVNPQEGHRCDFKDFLAHAAAEPRQAATTARPAAAPRTIWRASCSSSRPRPSSPTFPTAAPARRCRT